MRVLPSVAMLSLMLAAAAPLRAQIAERTATDSAALAAEATPSTRAIDSSATSSPSAVTGAALTGLRAGVHAPETRRQADVANTRVAAAAARAGLGQARAMMVVGVAALFAGAIIGGDPGTIIMIGGAVIGLVGLYDYLQ